MIRTDFSRSKPLNNTSERRNVLDKTGGDAFQLVFVVIHTEHVPIAANPIVLPPRAEPLPPSKGNFTGQAVPMLVQCCGLVRRSKPSDNHVCIDFGWGAKSPVLAHLFASSRILADPVLTTVAG